jgi:hypothetical protein
MSKDYRTRLVVANAVNIAVEVNEVIIENARNLVDAEIELPGLINRAYMIFHETGTVPMVDWSSQIEDTGEV